MASRSCSTRRPRARPDQRRGGHSSDAAAPGDVVPDVIRDDTDAGPAVGAGHHRNEESDPHRCRDDGEGTAEQRAAPREMFGGVVVRIDRELSVGTLLQQCGRDVGECSAPARLRHGVEVPPRGRRGANSWRPP